MNGKLVPNLESTKELLESLRRFQADMDRLYGKRAISDVDSCLNGFAHELENYITDEYQYKLKFEAEQREEVGHVRGEIICFDNGEIMCGEVYFSNVIELNTQKPPEHYSGYRKVRVREGIKERGVGSLYIRFDGKIDYYAEARLMRTFDSLSSACLEIASEHPYQEGNDG